MKLYEELQQITQDNLENQKEALIEELEKDWPGIKKNCLKNASIGLRSCEVSFYRPLNCSLSGSQIKSIIRNFLVEKLEAPSLQCVISEGDFQTIDQKTADMFSINW